MTYHMLTLIFCVLVGAFSPSMAETPNIALIGTGPYQWIQQGIMVTPRALDLAVQGLGFFTLQDNENTLYITRDGRFNLDSEGFIVYRDSELKLLSVDLNPIQLSEGARNSAGSVAKTFRIGLDGKISFAYLDGYVRTFTAQIGIALVARLNTSDRTSAHLYKLKQDERIYIGAPQSETRGSIYSNALESIDPYTYAVLDNNFERPSGNTEGKYLITTHFIVERNGKKLSTKRTRILNPSDQWLEFSNDDRVIVTGKLEVKDRGLQLKWIGFPSHYSCEPIELTSYLQVDQERIFTTTKGECHATMGIKVEMFK